jgi:lambda repressor-like predicted transcriptional regulator
MASFPCEPARARLRTLVGSRHRLPLSRQTIRTVMTKERLRADVADRVAVALGCHPCELWPEWFGAPE